MLVVDRAVVDRINGVDEAITFATLAAYKPVVEGEMIATVKLIPFGVEATLREVDVLLCASAMDPACRIDKPADVERTYPRQARTPFNVTGHPALAMMAGLSSNGLPLSVQFVGRNFAEATLFQVARAWERAGGTDEKHPPLM